MRIGIDVFMLEKELAGIGNYLYNLISQLEKLDTENEYFLYSFKNIKLPFNENKRWHKRCYGKIVGEKGFLWYLLFARYQLKKDNIDIFWSTQNLIFPGIPKRFKVVLTIHDVVWYFMSATMRTKLGVVLRFFGKKSLSRADYVVCVSESTLKEVEKIGVFIKNKKVVYDGICKKLLVEDSISDSKEMQNYIGSKFVLSVSTLEPRKNYIGILKSFALFCKQYPEFSNYNLLIVGKKGWKYEEIFQLYNTFEESIKNRIKFLGYIPDEQLVKLYSSAGCLLFPSFYEGVGFPIIEAMLYGCPVITSNCSSMVEVAADAAVLVNPTNYQEISESIYKLLSNKKLREDLKEKGSENILRFSWEKTALEMLNVFKTVNNS